MFRKSLLLIPVIAAAACSDSSGPNGRPITVSFSSQAPATTLGATLDVTVTGGGNTVIITKAQVVVRRVKLKEATSTVCSDDDSASDDCENTVLGPILVDLPLTTTTVSSIAATIPSGTYREIDFRIHKPGDDAADVAFRTANPTFANISIRVEGTYNGTPFVYTSALNEKQEVAFNPPVVVDADNKNVTIQINVGSWFKSGTTVINPATANNGQPNENLVRDNIRASIRALEDGDKNGR